MQSKIIKIIGFNVMLVCVAILAFSPAFFGWKIVGGNLFQTLVSANVIMFEVYGVFIGNGYLVKKLLGEPKSTYELPDNQKDVIKLLYTYSNVVKGIKIDKIVDQTHRMTDITKPLTELIVDRFGSGITYDKFMGVVSSAQQASLENLQTIARRIQSINWSEYYRLKKRDHKSKSETELFQIYNSSIDKCKKCIEAQDDLIVGLNKLYAEIMNDPNDTNNEVLDEITKLTESLKFYA